VTLDGLMRTRPIVVVTLALMLAASCAKGVPKPAGPSGTPQISWVLMYGDGDNPDREFACQSEPRTECVVPASKPDAQVFSDIHFYYHGVGTETRYEGTINIGYLRQGSGSEAYTSRFNVALKKNESITNSSVTGIVASTAGSYTVTISAATTATDTGKTQSIRASIPVIVK
jgi:hypothetical protein